MSDKESSSCTASGMRKVPRVETAGLIELVKQRPCLWDRADPDYRNRPRKDRAWAQVFQEIEPRYERMSRADQHEFGLVITRKWNNIRDCYKKSRYGSSRSSATGRPYLYADLLTFLDAIYDPQDRKRKACSFEGNSEEPEEHEDEWLSEVFVDMDASAQEPSSAKKPRTEYPRARDTTEAEDGIVSVLVNLIEREEDEDRAFFKSIIPTVKSLPEADKLMFRIEVMKLLNSWKKGGRRLIVMKRERQSPETETE